MSETDIVVVAARYHADSCLKFGVKLGQRARVCHCVYAVVGWLVSKCTFSRATLGLVTSLAISSSHSRKAQFDAGPTKSKCTWSVIS